MRNETLSDQLVREGVYALNQQDFSTARKKFKEAIEANDRNVDAFYNLGASELYMGNSLAAIKAYQDALNIAPTDYEVMYNLGTIYITTQELDKALAYLEKSLEINPYYVNSLNNLGVVHQYLGDLEASAKVYQEVIRIKEDDATAHNNLGVSITKQGLPGEAIPHFKKAIEIDANYASAYNNLGNALQQLGAYNDALEFYKKALEISPQYVEAHINIASNYHELRDLQKAIYHYEEALKYEPENIPGLSHLLHIYQQANDFEKIKIYKEKLKDKNIDPLINIMYSSDLAENLSVARSWSESIKDRTKKYPPFKYNWKNSKIRVGYINNFQDKPVGYLIRDLFKLHNRKKFEIYAFSYGSSPGGDLREEVAHDVDHFIDIASLKNFDAAKLINDKQIDILVDLKGYTKGEKMEVLALHPAKVQITYLGFPGTTGADFFDYILTDRILTPKPMQKYYTEKFLYMPSCYQIYSKPDYQKVRVKRSDYDLPKKGIVFSCLNQSVKIDEKVFESWMKILKKVKDSVLWLVKSNELQVENLRNFAQSKKIDPDRLIFTKSVPFPEHLSRIPLADLALDPFIYSGGATTAHTLYTGVPVITKTGKHYLSRMSSSIVTYAGLKKLVVDSTKDYEDIAIKLANSKSQLSKYRQFLKKNFKQRFETKKFVRDLEKIYEKIS